MILRRIVSDTAFLASRLTFTQHFIVRKARMQATEISRDRDNLNIQIERLRKELDAAKREVTDVRNSVVQEKQSLESRLEDERRAREKVRQQLDQRVEELQRRKSKFACL